MQTIQQTAPDRTQRRLRVGVWFMSLIAVMTIVSPFLADWNVTHIYNPNWPPHAKFHNAQTMCFGVICGALALAYLWRRGSAPIQDLATGAIFAGMYWAAQLPAILFPGTAFYDPDHATGKPHLFGVEIVQAHMAVLLLILIAFAFYRERRALLRAS